MANNSTGVHTIALCEEEDLQINKEFFLLSAS